MTFLYKSLPGSQDILLTLRSALKKDEPLTKEEMRRLYEVSKKVTKADGDRLFVVMTAQAKGWNFAKELDFYQSGIRILVAFEEKRCKKFFHRVLQVLRPIAIIKRWPRIMQSGN